MCIGGHPWVTDFFTNRILDQQTKSGTGEFKAILIVSVSENNFKKW